MKSLKTALCVAVCSVSMVSALPMHDVVESMLQQHERLLAQQANVSRAQFGVDQALADWFPTLELSASGGYEKHVKPTPPNTEVWRNVQSAELNQKIFDFGKTRSQYDIAKLRVHKEHLTLEGARQNLMLEGIKAYLNVIRYQKALNFSIEAEQNIKKQTGMEEARVRRGAGLSTDVLQTKSTLAGAMATRVRAEGQYITALNRFQALFQDISDPDILEMPAIPYSALPQTLDEALILARQHNLTLRGAQIELLLSKQQVRSSQAALYPTVSMGASFKHKYNDAGLLGRKEEALAKVDIRYMPFAGGRDLAAIRSAKEGVKASEWQLLDAQNNVEERVKNAWQNFMMARSNAQFLRNQANISSEFLENARKERKLGKRSMMDLMNAETSYINVLSGALSAETDMAIAAYALFEAMGTLNLDVLANHEPLLLEDFPILDSLEETVLPEAQQDSDAGLVEPSEG